MRKTVRSSADASHRCSLCGGKGRTVRQFRQRGDEVLYLSRCERCLSEFLDPQPSSEWLTEEYRDYYTRREASAESSKQAFFGELLDSLDRDLSGQKILDVGAAEGELVSALKRRWPDAQATALETHPDAQPLLEALDCRYERVDVVDWLAGRPADRFDLVFLLDVLEHLRDPLAVVRDLARDHLQPSGAIVASFPVATSASRRILGRLWPQYKVEHLFYLSPAAVKRLETVARLQRRTLRPLHKRLPLAYFLSVGGAFGPALTRRACRIAQLLLPRAWGRLRIPLGIGECLWIAVRDEHSSSTRAGRSSSRDRGSVQPE